MSKNGGGGGGVGRLHRQISPKDAPCPLPLAHPLFLLSNDFKKVPSMFVHTNKEVPNVQKMNAL
jgi:hypothetical protein